MLDGWRPGVTKMRVTGCGIRHNKLRFSPQPAFFIPRFRQRLPLTNTRNPALNAGKLKTVQQRRIFQTKANHIYTYKLQVVRPSVVGRVVPEGIVWASISEKRMVNKLWKCLFRNVWSEMSEQNLKFCFQINTFICGK